MLVKGPLLAPFAYLKCENYLNVRVTGSRDIRGIYTWPKLLLPW